ncbi:DUF86 domain-containing protein [bacterium]|nr:DUF86 domain-containing protein [bacterium]
MVSTRTNREGCDQKQNERLSYIDFCANFQNNRTDWCGQPSKNIPDAFKEKHGEIEWEEMARMRDRLIHHYFGVDY